MMRRIIFAIKYAMHKHRLMTVYLLCAVVLTLIVVSGAILNAFWDSALLSMILSALCVCLNLGTAYYTWLLYDREFMKSYREFAESYPNRLKMYEDLKATYPSVAEQFTPPTDFSESFRKLRWIYILGIPLNVALAAYNGWHLWGLIIK
jgi:hypothetical protein